MWDKGRTTVTGYYRTCCGTIVGTALRGADLSRKRVLVDAEVQRGAIGDSREAQNHVALRLGDDHQMRHTQLTSDGGVVLHSVVTREARRRT
jgi:hypothetical protein